MPQITFKNEPPKEFANCEPGDHAFQILEAGIKMSKTSTNEYVELKVKELESGAIARENLVFCESMQWKIEQFLKCIGYVPQVGDLVDFNKEFLAKVVVNSRGWARWGVEEYEKTGTKEKKKRNVIETFYTDKGVIPRGSPIHDEDVPTPAAAAAKPVASPQW